MKRLLRAVRRSDQIVSVRYELFLMRGEMFPLRKDVLDAVMAQLDKGDRQRWGSFAASASGTCMRAQIYGYLGTPSGAVVGPDLAAIFNNGHWAHLKLQAAFLQADIIDSIEVPSPWPNMRAMGTMDGVGTVPENHPRSDWRGLTFGLEVKSCNSNVYRQLETDGPEKYARQVERYFLTSGVDLFVVFVENKDTNKHFEWVIEPNPKALARARAELVQLNEYVDDRTLPSRLPECRKLTGPKFNNCPYGTKEGPCAAFNTWKSARQVARETRKGSYEQPLHT